MSSTKRMTVDFSEKLSKISVYMIINNYYSRIPICWRDIFILARESVPTMYSVRRKNKKRRIILIVSIENFLRAQSTDSRIPALITIRRRIAFPFAQVAWIDCGQWNERQYPESECLGECAAAHQRLLCQGPRPFGKNPPSLAHPDY